MIRRCATYLLLGAALFTASCGFSPVYGVQADNSAAQKELAQIYIDNIPDREGQLLRNELIDRFYRHGRPINPTYRLSVSNLSESVSDLDITKTADSTRGQLRITASVALFKYGEDEPVLSRSLRSITSYNVLGSEFATNVTEQDARENALDGLANQIEIQLGLYFNR